MAAPLDDPADDDAADATRAPDDGSAPQRMRLVAPAAALASAAGAVAPPPPRAIEHDWYFASTTIRQQTDSHGETFHYLRHSRWRRIRSRRRGFSSPSCRRRFHTTTRRRARKWRAAPQRPADGMLATPTERKALTDHPRSRLGGESAPARQAPAASAPNAVTSAPRPPSSSERARERT